MATDTLFERIYRDHAPAIHRFLLGMSGNYATAQDLTSETFVRAWAGADRIRLPTVKAYLFAIARNLYLQSLRRRREPAPLSPELEDPRVGPEQDLEARDELMAVVHELSRLSESERAALLLRSEGFSYEEIAERLNIKLSAAKVRVHRARVKLQSRRLKTTEGTPSA